MEGQEGLRLGPTATGVLQVLIEQAGRMISQEELPQQVWAETAVSKKALQGCIRQAGVRRQCRQTELH